MTKVHHSSETDADHLKLMMATGMVGIWELDTQTGVAWRNLRHDEIFGYDALLPEWTYAMFMDHVVQEDRAMVDQYYGDAIAQQQPWAFECRIRRNDGQDRWISVHGRPLRLPTGEVTKLIGHVIDITRAKRTEEHLRLVTAELNHRVSNMLAMIKALIHISAKSTDDTASFAQVLEQRIAALGRTHQLLMMGSGAAIPLADIMKSELAAFLDLSSRVRLHLHKGIALHRSVAERFVLVIHELMTNAIKYGALSNDSGCVTLSSELMSDGRVRLLWRETGGPEALPSGTTGFGSMLLSQALGDHGDIVHDLRREGLVCTIDIRTEATPVAVDPTEAGRPQADDSPDSLAGKSILVLDDEPLIGISYQAQLEGEGVKVVGPFVSCDRALEALNGPDCIVDAAILDVNLGNETSYGVADRLVQAGKPFIFTTGYEGELGLAERYPDAIILTKPAMFEEIENGLRQVISKSACSDPFC